jgi:hypothetical protein
MADILARVGVQRTYCERVSGWHWAAHRPPRSITFHSANLNVQPSSAARTGLLVRNAHPSGATSARHFRVTIHGALPWLADASITCLDKSVDDLLLLPCGLP